MSTSIIVTGGASARPGGARGAAPRVAAAVSLAAALAVLAGGACRRPAESAAGAKSCAERASEALDAVRAVQDQHRSCARAEDCAVIFFATGCFGACGWPVTREDGVDELSGIAGEIQRTTCTRYAEEGCKQMAFPCPDPNAAVVCRDGRCER
jgi:hypothetical protein